MAIAFLAEEEARQNERLNTFSTQLGALNARLGSVPLFSQASLESQSEKYSLLDMNQSQLDELLTAIGEQRSALERTQSESSAVDKQTEGSRRAAALLKRARDFEALCSTRLSTLQSLRSDLKRSDAHYMDATALADWALEEAASFEIRFEAVALTSRRVSCSCTSNLLNFFILLRISILKILLSFLNFAPASEHFP